jgi:hypothetical protein
VVRRQGQQARHLHAPTPLAPFYWLLPMRVKLLSQNKEKKFCRKTGWPRPRRADLINRISSQSSF